MANNPLANISAAELKRAARIREEIDKLERQLGAILSSGAGSAPGLSDLERPTVSKKKRRKKKRRAKKGFGKKKAAAKKKRRAKKKSGSRKKRHLSPEAREKIAAAARRRWARERGEAV